MKLGVSWESSPALMQSSMIIKQLARQSLGYFGYGLNKLFNFGSNGLSKSYTQAVILYYRL